MCSRMKKIHENQNGSALIIVMCVLCILTALILTMLFASYQTLSSAQSSSAKEQSRLSAVTFAEELERELLKTGELNDEGDITGIRRLLKEKIDNNWASGDRQEIEVSQGEDTETELGEITVTSYVEYADENQSNYDSYNVYIVTTCVYHEQTYKESRCYGISQYDNMELMKR